MKNPVFINCDSTCLPLADGVADLILTSPPYNANIQYDVWNDCMPWPEYWALASRWACEMFRVSAPGGHAVLNVAIDIRTKPTGASRAKEHRERVDVFPLAMPWVETMKQARWVYRGSHIWLKATAPEEIRRSHARFGHDAVPAIINGGELVLVFLNTTTGRPARPNVKPDYLEDRRARMLDANALWCIHQAQPGRDRNWHPCPWPDELAERGVRRYSWPGDIVLDPFSGTGVVPRVAARMGRIGIGCEISEQCIRNAEARCDVRRAHAPARPKQGRLALK